MTFEQRPIWLFVRDRSGPYRTPREAFRGGGAGAPNYSQGASVDDTTAPTGISPRGRPVEPPCSGLPRVYLDASSPLPGPTRASETQNLGDCGSARIGFTVRLHHRRKDGLRPRIHFFQHQGLSCPLASHSISSGFLLHRIDFVEASLSQPSGAWDTFRAQKKFHRTSRPPRRNLPLIDRAKAIRFTKKPGRRSSLKLVEVGFEVS